MAFFSLGDDHHNDDIGPFSHWLDDGDYSDKDEEEKLDEPPIKIKKKHAKSKSKKIKRFNKTKT